jgi:hypothetical protein
VSLDGDWEHALGAGPVSTSFSFPLPEPEVVLTSARPPVTSVSQICMPQDMSPTCRTTTSMSSSVGTYFSSSDIAAWSRKIGMQSDGG